MKMTKKIRCRTRIELANLGSAIWIMPHIYIFIPRFFVVSPRRMIDFFLDFLEPLASVLVSEIESSFSFSGISILSPPHLFLKKCQR